MQAEESRMTNRQAADARADADPSDGRDESVNERMDRNWNEILQELRVTQTGTQIFTGFLLTIAFQQRFSDLTTFQTRVYLILVIAAVLTTALGLAPVNLHRALFRKGAKVTVVHPCGRSHHADRNRAVDLRPGDREDCRADHGRHDATSGDHPGNAASLRWRWPQSAFARR